MPLKLGDDVLPFTDTAKHLGHFLDNSRSMIKQDMKTKRAMTIQKNNEICQEFSFCHPATKLMLNQIYNFSYTGCQLWDLFSREAVCLENSYNVSVRKMLGLPVNTHRYLIQPLAGGTHVKQVFARRFLKFCECLANCQKTVVRETYEKIRLNVRTITGSNLSEISNLVGKPVLQLNPSNASEIVYESIDSKEEYRIDFIKEIIDVKDGTLEVDGFDVDEIRTILEHLCSN